jgi:hypothetical protein
MLAEEVFHQFFLSPERTNQERQRYCGRDELWGLPENQRDILTLIRDDTNSNGLLSVHRSFGSVSTQRFILTTSTHAILHRVQIPMEDFQLQLRSKTKVFLVLG